MYRFSLLCHIGDDVIRPCKICEGSQRRVPRSIHSMLSQTISTPICIRSAFFLRRTQEKSLFLTLSVTW